MSAITAHDDGHSTDSYECRVRRLYRNIVDLFERHGTHYMHGLRLVAGGEPLVFPRAIYECLVDDRCDELTDAVTTLIDEALPEGAVAFIVADMGERVLMFPVDEHVGTVRDAVISALRRDAYTRLFPHAGHRVENPETTRPQPFSWETP